MPNPTPRNGRGGAGVAAELQVRLKQLHKVSALTYEQLAERTNLSRSSIGNYLNDPAGRPVQTLQLLLDKLGASTEERARVLDLHRQTMPGGGDPAEVGWAVRARSEGYEAWPMAEFTPTAAVVHTAIGRRHTSWPDDPGRDLQPPPYVPRAHDPALRRDIADAAGGKEKALIVLRGTSSTGKTRSLFEAVHALCPGWTVIRPATAVALRDLPTSGLLDRRLVVWLNELQGFLGPNGTGLSTHVLRELYGTATQPVVLVGTMWPDKLRVAIDPRDESTSETRELLGERTEWVHWHDVPATLTTEAERAAAQRLATRDERLADALADRDRFGFAQTLAGAHELLDHYTNADEATMPRLLLDAAGDARRLGHASALPAELLRAVTISLWREEYGPTRPPDGWFDHALAYAITPLRGERGVRALTPLDDLDDPDEGEPIGYGLADYLEQHLTHARRTRPVPDRAWESLRTHTSRPDDLAALAQAADNRARYIYAESLFRKAAASGDRRALRSLVGWLKDRPGRELEVEGLYREAMAVGDPTAARDLAWWLRTLPGREADAEAVFREAAAAGDREAQSLLAAWLRCLPGREADAAALYEHMAAAGDVLALNMVMGGREADVEAACRRMAAAGDRRALLRLARYLASWPQRMADAEAMYREVRTSNDPYAPTVKWPPDRPDWQADAEAVFREAAAAGDPLAALGGLARWLSKLPGREADAEAAFREAAAAGAPDALLELAEWLGQRPGREANAEAVYREAGRTAGPTGE